MSRTPDLPSGFVHGRLTIVDRVKSGRVKAYLCRCQCGTEKVILKGNLMRTCSCGCLRQDVSRRHGAWGTPTYRSWDHMIQRCTNPAHERFADWGGRGIKVFQPWREFKNFLADMGERPDGTTLDRIDNDGDYEPANCRWATSMEQHLNKRNSRRDHAAGQQAA